MSDNNDVDISFYDNYIPTLPAGTYQIKVTQEITQPEGETNPIPTIPYPPLTQRVSVAGPRFSLDAADVHRAFPAKGATGSYDQYLPQLVMNKSELPWERPVPYTGNTQKDAPYPWLALVVFGADELLLPDPNGGPPQAPPTDLGNANPTLTGSFPLAQVLTDSSVSPGPPANSRGPAISAAELDLGQSLTDTWCKVIDITADTFNRLLPARQDLPWLCHVRKVSTEAKQSSAPAWYSACIANRFALAPSGNAPSRKNIVHLLSLEGFQDCFDATTGLPTAPAKDAHGNPCKWMRLVSLYSWSFQCLTDPGETFSQLMLGLLPSPQTDISELLLKMPLPAGASGDDAATTAALNRIEDGYDPMSYAMRSGEASFAWYRGPLASVVTQRFLETTAPADAVNPEMPFTVANAMIYNPATGLFDQSYATAWTTGRLLGLASKSYATSVLQWRRTAHSLVDTLLENARSPAMRTKLQNDGVLDEDGNLTATGTQDLAKLISQDLITDAFLDFLAGEFAENIANSVDQPGSSQRSSGPVAATAPSATLGSAQADLAKLMANPSVVALLQQLSGLLPLGTTDGDLSGTVTTLTLAAPYAVQALDAGSKLSVADPDSNFASFTVASAVAAGDKTVSVASATLTTPLLSGATVTITGGTVEQSDVGSILPSSVVQWLAQRALLYGVPFDNLVPDPRMLPAESLRFFYVDRNWIDALLDGALSVGVQTSRDSLFNQLMRNPLHRIVDSIMLTVRDEMRGITSPAPQGTLGSMGGFVLRSALLAGYPGLQVQAFDADGNAIKPLRLDLVSDNVMLGIFADTPAKITFSQPGEGLVFGTEDEGIDARYLPGNSAGKAVGSLIEPKSTLAPADFPSRPNASPNPVLVIAGSGGLVGKLEALYGNSSPTLTPASFAVEMVRSPEQMVFTWQDA